MTDYKHNLPAAQPKKKKRPPFVKNLFLGIFDYEFLTYLEPQHVDRYYEFEEWLKPIKNYMKTVDPKKFEETSEIPSHVLQKFRELGIFGARIPEDYNGMNLLNSEFMRLLETVGTIPPLGLFLLKQSVPPVDLLNKYGSVEQKLNYFPKIASGQSLATVAITESESGPGVINFTTKAVLSDCGNYWIINGEKLFVPNTNFADVIIAFGHAMIGGDLEQRTDTISSYIVEAETEGVHIAQDSIETTGLKGFKMSKVILKNVKVPKTNIIGNIGDGNKQLIDLFVTGRHYVAGLIIPVLKNLLGQLTKDVLNRKHFDKNLHETAFCQNIIAELTSSIYSIESVLYLTTSMTDIYDGQDVQLETALVEQYCVEECIKIVQKSLWLVGARACTLVYPFEQLLRDAFTLTNCETSLLDTKIYSGLLGMQHFGLHRGDHIKKIRNPFMNPIYVLRTVFNLRRKVLKLYLEDYLHPSLKECAAFCDKSLFQLKESSDRLLMRDGSEIVYKQNDLQRISEMAMLIYVYIAVLSRASRSYCIGNRNSDHEVKLCFIICYTIQKKINAIAEDIRASEYSNGDYLKQELSKLHFEMKDFSLAHPLQRNY